MATRQPPAPEVMPKKSGQLADFVHRQHRHQLAGLGIDAALEHQQAGMRRRPPPACATGSFGGTDRSSAPASRRAIGQKIARDAIGQGRLADAGRRRRSARPAAAGRCGWRARRGPAPRPARAARRSRADGQSPRRGRCRSGSERCAFGHDALIDRNARATAAQIAAATSSSVPGCVDHEAAVGIALGDVEKGLAQPFMEIAVEFLEAGFAAAARPGARQARSRHPDPASR